MTPEVKKHDDDDDYDDDDDDDDVYDDEPQQHLPREDRLLRNFPVLISFPALF